MKLTRRTAAALIAALTLSLFACGQGGPGPRAQPEGSHAPITINRFNNLITERFVSALKEAYPEINLQIVSYAGRNSSGYAQYSLEHNDMTDIYVTTQSFGRDIQPDRLIDLSGCDFVDNFSAYILNSLDIEGGIYLLPSGYTLAGMYYNKTLMEENGWQVPESFAELLELIPRIEAAGYRPCGNAMDLEGYPFNYFFSLGNTVYFGSQEGVGWKDAFPKGNASAMGSEGLLAAARYYGEWVAHGLISDQHMSIEDFQEKGDTVFYLCLGLSSFTHETETGRVYEFGVMPWLSRDGSNNMLTQNVSRYFGVNRRLLEEGSEQKLQDALHVLQFLSTEAGQEALMNGFDMYVSPLSKDGIPLDSPYHEVAGLVRSGRTVPMVYVGWEELIVPVADDLRGLIRGELSPEELPAMLDATYHEVAELGTGDVFGTLTETLSYEKTAELCAIAEGRAVNADCAMISLNEYHGEDHFNSDGLGWYLWEGKIDTQQVHIIRPNCSTISVLTLTGAEIKAMQAAGYTCNEGDRPYDYLLVTRGAVPLQDAGVYRLAISTNEVPEAMAGLSEIFDISTETAIKDYLSLLGTFGAADILWEA